LITHTHIMCTILSEMNLKVDKVSEYRKMGKWNPKGVHEVRYINSICMHIQKLYSVKYFKDMYWKLRKKLLKCKYNEINTSNMTNTPLSCYSMNIFRSWT
jgi:hypothetical protein